MRFVTAQALILGGSAAAASCGSPPAPTPETQQTPDLSGVWSTSLTLGTDEAFAIADYGCFIGCPESAYDHLRDLLANPANDDRPFRELMVEAWRHAGQELGNILTERGLARRDELGYIDQERLNCLPQGFVAQISNPLPLEIVQRDDLIEMRYEVFNVERTIYMDGRAHPDDFPLSRYGHSIGRYDGDALIIETTRIEPGRFTVDFGGGGHSEALETTERYTRSADGNLLRLEMTIEDPVMLRTPLVYHKVWRYTLDIALLQYECELYEVPGDA